MDTDTNPFVAFMDEALRPAPTTANLLAFVQKIADGKRMLRFSHMEGCAECTYCDAGQRIEYTPGLPDTIQHKPYCVVIAARRFFPDFKPSDFNDTKSLRHWGEKDAYKLTW